MKRFYCVVCKKVRRARHWPKHLQFKQDDKPGDNIRQGECDKHYYDVNVSYRKVAR